MATGFCGTWLHDWIRHFQLTQGFDSGSQPTRHTHCLDSRRSGSVDAGVGVCLPCCTQARFKKWGLCLCPRWFWRLHGLQLGLGLLVGRLARKHQLSGALLQDIERPAGRTGALSLHCFSDRIGAALVLLCHSDGRHPRRSHPQLYCDNSKADSHSVDYNSGNLFGTKRSLFYGRLAQPASFYR